MPVLAPRSASTAVRLRGLAAASPSPAPLLVSLPACHHNHHHHGRRSIHGAKWRPVSVLDEWVAKEARPISLRQLMVFGRSLTESRLISSANYVRTELPTRIAHRIRDMQQLPFVVVTNPHISEVYELYYNAFDTFRRVREVKTLEDNEKLCKVIGQMLADHLAVIPKLAMGVLECSDLMDSAELDKFMNTILRSRISRRVIAEQHVSLTETFRSTHSTPAPTPPHPDGSIESIGEVLTKCVARDVVAQCGATVRSLARSAYGPDVGLPDIRIEGHLDANFPFILSHLEYIVGELLRNSVQAVIERQARLGEELERRRQRRHGGGGGGGGGKPGFANNSSSNGSTGKPPPIEVTICEAQHHVIVRVSDQGGGVPRDVLPRLWSFSRGGPSRQARLENLGRVPKMAATLQEVRVRKDDDDDEHGADKDKKRQSHPHDDKSDPKKQPPLPLHSGSLSSLSTRPPNLRLGLGLPLSRVYAEYWAGTLELHSLEGYGVDAFLQISKLGNKNEQLATRASMDAV